MSKRTIKKLGELLIDFNYISQEQFNEALKQQKISDKKLGRQLVDLGYIKENDLIQVLEFQMGIPHADLSNYKLEPLMARFIPESLARKNMVVALAKDNNKLKVAMADPSDLVTIDDIERSSGLKVEPLIASTQEIEHALDQIYVADDMDTAEIMADLENMIPENESEIGELRQMVEEAPIIQFANAIITQAVQSKASDIHVEPQENRVRIRYRIDGVLLEKMSAPRHTRAALTSRFKIMADLDITESRTPQDGRVKMKIKGSNYDFRVSTLPVIHGEKVVIRILNQDHGLLDINNLGFNNYNLDKFKDIIKRPHGIFLVTGPTGSGKSTTLFAALNELNNESKNIVTIEDPVEYQLKGINQVQAKPKSGLTFAKTLRSILRQDPDIVMIGEIRDEETSAIAVRAALTGHLVLSTLHTNDAVSSITRLIDMGIPDYLVAASINGLMAQRLVRKLCPKCKSPHHPSEDELLLLESIGGANIEPRVDKLYSAVGCPHCNQTGYRGRLAIQELLVMDNVIKDMIIKDVGVNEIENYASSQGMKLLKEDGIEKMINGLTTFEELRQIVY